MQLDESRSITAGIEWKPGWYIKIFELSSHRLSRKLNENRRGRWSKEYIKKTPMRHMQALSDRKHGIGSRDSSVERMKTVQYLCNNLEETDSELRLVTHGFKSLRFLNVNIIRKSDLKWYGWCRAPIIQDLPLKKNVLEKRIIIIIIQVRKKKL